LLTARHNAWALDVSSSHVASVKLHDGHSRHMQHTPPGKAAEELRDLLDSDTDTFVIKLYRTVIFETERAAAGL
jgi:hypothetical protein